MGDNRIIEISKEGAHLGLRNEQLVMKRRDQPEKTVPLSDLAVIVVAHPQTTYSHPLLVGGTWSNAGYL